MKNGLIKSTLIATAAAIIMSGCASSSSNNTSPTVKIYQAPKSNIVLKTSSQFYLDNGSVIFKNGEKLFDQDGDILKGFYVNNQFFYTVLNENTKNWKIKNKQKKVIKEFTDSLIHVFSKSPTEAIIYESLPGNTTFSKYDNVYSFNGNSLNQIDKNVQLERGYYTKGEYTIKKIFTRNSKKTPDRYEVYNRYTKEKLNLPTFYAASVYKMHVVGIAGDFLYYTNEEGLLDRTHTLHAVNLKTGKDIVLLNGTLMSSENNKKLEFLKFKNDIVLKIYNSSTKELKTNKQNTYIAEKIIHLNTLNEIKGISPDFETIAIPAGFTNMGGGYTGYSLQVINSYNLYEFPKKIF